ncbi:MAG: AraC family transcriptional regulator [Salinivirgaceae bacterium]|nr:AraC family transcriptional regulator [Salinivirgaceae bacterium]
MANSKHIPTYSLGEFTTPNQRSKMYQVEVFDANRHFQVSYPHKHDFYEVLFLTKGSGFHIIDSHKYFIKPPSIFFLSPGQAHKLELSHDIHGYIFLFTAEFYLLNQANKNKLLELPFFFSVDQDNPPLLLKEETDINFLHQLFIRGCQEVTSENSELVSSILDLILQTCNKLYPAETFGIQKSRGHLLVKNLFQLIEENYQKNLSINEYAEMLSITPNHLTQMVKQVTGNTSAKLLQNKVILETKRLLIHTEMTVTEIADYMNFSDQSYFTKFFKKACGTTPLQYRKRKQ